MSGVTGWRGQNSLSWTDHKNLEYIGSAKRLSSHQACWALFFDRFDFTLSHQPGSKNIKPEALSHQFEHLWEEVPGDTILFEGVVVGWKRLDKVWKCQLIEIWALIKTATGMPQLHCSFPASGKLGNNSLLREG